MKSLQEAKNCAETEGTESALKYRRTAGFAIRAIVVIIAVGLRSVGLTGLITEHRRTESEKAVATGTYKSQPGIPPATVSGSSGTLTIPVGGRSKPILPIEGQYPEFVGFGKFLSHAVRADDNSVCTFGEACFEDGPLLKEYYVTNEDTEEVKVTFKFKPRKK